MNVIDMPTNAFWFLAFWWGMIGIGILLARLFIVERLRVISGGTESARLRRGKRVVDALGLLVLLWAGFWLAMALARAIMGG